MICRARDVARTTRHARHVTHGTKRNKTKADIPGRGALMLRSHTPNLRPCKLGTLEALFGLVTSSQGSSLVSKSFMKDTSSPCPPTWTSVARLEMLKSKISIFQQMRDQPRTKPDQPRTNHGMDQPRRQVPNPRAGRRNTG